MKLYKVWQNGDFGDCDGCSKWTSRKADIPGLKREVSENNRAEYSPGPYAEEIEFQPTVSGILKMLNDHADRG